MGVVVCRALPVYHAVLEGLLDDADIPGAQHKLYSAHDAPPHSSSASACMASSMTETREPNENTTMGLPDGVTASTRQPLP